MQSSVNDAAARRVAPLQSAGDRALSSALVRCIAGPTDDQTVMDIIRTGAGERQLMAAVEQMQDEACPQWPEDNRMVARLTRILADSGRPCRVIAREERGNGRRS